MRRSLCSLPNGTRFIPAFDNGPWRSILRAITFLAVLYLFFVSIDLMSAAFKMFGREFADRLISTASDPLAGLIIGFLTTSLIQSSSTTTSIIVGLVAAGSLPLGLAILMIMGANIGTTVTNTIVSIGHFTRPDDHSRFRPPVVQYPRHPSSLSLQVRADRAG